MKKNFYLLFIILWYKIKYYYAAWVFRGPPYAVLPNKNADPHLIGDFIEVLIKFWKNGGSIVFMAEGGAKEQLTYQANLFLEMPEFEQEPSYPSKKTKFRLLGEHAGTKVLLPDESETLSKNQTFNRSSQFFKQCDGTKLSHNIGRIFEGITISCFKTIFNQAFIMNDIKSFFNIE